MVTYVSHLSFYRMRHLRSEDRKANEHRYPQLYFPEIYLLHAGYKQFFAEAEELCQPQFYVPMLHADHTEDMKKFRARSKSMKTGFEKMGRSRKTMSRRSMTSPSLSQTTLQF